MASRSYTSDLILTQSISKLMWKFAIPSVATMVIFGLNGLVDAIFVGQLIGPSALSAIALAAPLSSIMMAAGAWVGAGAANVLSVALGEKDENTQRSLFGTAGLLTIVMGNVCAIPFYFFSVELIRFMGGTGEVLNLGADYLELLSLGTTFWVFGTVFNMIIRAEGKIHKAAVMTSYGLVVNLILSPIFIIKYDMGVSGAALATNIGMLVYCLVAFIYFMRNKVSFINDTRKLVYDKVVAKMILKTGFPSFILAAMGMLQAFVIFNSIAEVGTRFDLAFFAAANRVLLFLVTPLFGLTRAFQPIVGINFGAKKYDRVKESFLVFTLTGVVIMAPFWLGMTFFPTYSLHLILPGVEFDPIDLWYFQVGIMVLPILPMVYMALTLFSATRRSQLANIIGLTRQIIFYIPIMYFLPRYIGISGIYYGATTIDMFISAWIGYTMWKLFKELDQLKKKEEEAEKVDKKVIPREPEPEETLEPQPI